VVIYHRAFGEGIAGYGRRLKSVTFLQDNATLASARLRNIIPARELEKRGWPKGSDVIVLSKHNWTWSDAIKLNFGAVVFDVCDDWFDSEHGEHYRYVCSVADAVTCNSDVMRDRILEVTGRFADVIDDPWEHDEKPPGAGHGVLWFGQNKGLAELRAVAEDIKYPLRIVTDHKSAWCTEWTPEVQAEALEACRCVFIPPTKMTARSANRAITAIRAGRMVVAGHIPAYDEIPGIFVDDDWKENLDTAMNQDMTDRIKVAQKYVADRYSPERIADQWETVLNKL
jgi:hypothetical protein